MHATGRLPLFDHQTGALNRHVAHHLFPSLPPNRLIEITPQVEEICRKHGIPFRRQGVLATTRSVLRRVIKHSLPDRTHRWFRDRAKPAAQPYPAAEARSVDVEIARAS